MSSDPIVIQKQMGITHAEFMRLLPRALGSEDYKVNGKIIGFSPKPDASFNIQLGTESVRQIALMKMPTMPVTLTIAGIDDDERAAMLLRFDRAYQRGGG